MEHILPLKAIDDSELFSALKTNGLKGPNATAYDPKLWIEKFTEISQATKRDFDLLAAALYFGLEFESLRSHIDGKLPKLAPTDAIDFVVATTNIQTITVRSRTEAKLRKRARAAEIGYMGDTGDIRVRNSGYQDLNPDDAVASLADGVANLLFRVSETNRTPSPVDRQEALERALSLATYASIEQGLKDLWNRAVWDGCTITKYENHTSFAAGDEAFAKLWLAWRRRFETIILQEGRLQAGEAIARNDHRRHPPILARTVLGIDDRRGHKQAYIVGKARRGGDEQASTIGAIEACYLGSFLDETLPNYQQLSLTYRDLWRAWWVLQDIANIHQMRLPKRGILTWGHVNSYALRFSVPRTIAAIADALELSETAAEAVIEVFTTNPDLSDRNNASDLFRHGTWGRPILRSQLDDRARIVIASLLSPNPVLTMERWMTRTGMTDDPVNRRKKTVRGKVFERIVRDRLRTAGAKNKLLTGFRVSSLPASGQGTEEIDVLLCFGSTIAVCEVKCLNVPFEALDRYNHLRKLE